MKQTDSEQWHVVENGGLERQAVSKNIKFRYFILSIIRAN